MNGWKGLVLFALLFFISANSVFGQTQNLSLTVSPTGLVVVGTKLSLDSCWIGFSPSELANAFLTDNATIQFNVDGGSWAGLPALFAGLSSNDCGRSTYVVPMTWAGHTIGLRTIYRPTGQTSNVVGVGVSSYSLTLFVIQVTVLDQNGNNYDGVSVELWQGGTLLASGVSSGGTWSTPPIPGGGRSYEIHVYNGQTSIQPVRVFASDLFVTFQLTRGDPSPILVLSNVSTTPAQVFVGTSFDVQFHVINTGDLPGLRASLILNLTDPFAMVGSGTTLFIGAIGVNGTATLSGRVAVDQNAKTGTYSIPYTFSYSDTDNYSYTSSGTFGLTVNGTPQIEIASISIDPASLSPETSGIMTITLVNAGTERAVDVRIHVFNGDDILTNTISYVGEIDPGKSTTITFGVAVQDSAVQGLRSLNVAIEYSDPYAAHYDTSRLYDTYVFPPQSFLPTFDIVLFLVVVLAVVFGYVAFRRLGYKLW